jgi:hypothetical protein
MTPRRASISIPAPSATRCALTPVTRPSRVISRSASVRYKVRTRGEPKSGSNARPSIQVSSTAAIRSTVCCLGRGMNRENRTPRSVRIR